MTSPGGNLVEIRVVVRDQSAPGFDAATRRAKTLAQAVGTGPQSAAAAMKEAEKQASGLGGTLRRVGEVAGGVLVANVVQQMAQRAVQLVKSTAEAASGLSESVNAVNKTFEAGAQEITDWGQANANAIGLSQRAFNQSATVVGAMLKNQGLATEEVTQHTTRLAERAADMASVFNTDVGDALAAIQAGLRGEIDPLERYGVSLSAAAVEQRALADSGKTAVRELTAQDKALARLAVLYEQTADVAGDFRDTSDGMANAQRIATAQIEDAQAKIGTAFMPVLAKASQITGDLAEGFAELPAPIQATTVVMIGLGAAVGFLGPKAMAAKASLDAMAASGTRAGRAMHTVAVGASAAGSALAGAFIVGQISNAIDGDLNPSLDALNKGLEQYAHSGKLGSEATRVLGEDFKDLDASVSGLATTPRWLTDLASSVSMFGISSPLSVFGMEVDDAKERVKTFDQALAQLVRGGNMDAAQQHWERLAADAQAAGVSVERLEELFPEYAAAMEVAAKSTNKVAEAADEAAKSIDELDKEYDELIDTALGFEEAQDNAANAVERLRQQVEQEGAALTGNTQAARDNREMVRGLVEDYKAMIIEAAESGRSTEGMAQELENLLVGMGFAREEVQRYIEILVALQEEMDRIKSVEAKVRLTYETNKPYGAGFLEFAHGGITGAAGGGPRGSRTLVGEQGPEIVDLPFGSTVHSNGDSMRMLSQASHSAPASGPTEIVFSGDLDSGLANVIQKLIRNGQIIIRPAGG